MISRSVVDAAIAGRPANSAGWARGNCPFCLERTGKPDRRASFGFQTTTGWVGCFKCGIKGLVDGFDEFDDVPDVVVPTRPKIEMPEDFHELTRGEGRTAVSLDRAREYLRSRGLVDESVWKAAHVGACLSGRYAGRVIVPIFTIDSEWAGFVGRVWRKRADIPYLYPPGMNRRELLYNEAAVYRETDEPLFVVEGVLDALALWPDAVAVLGKPSEAQLEILINAERPVAVAFDGDARYEGEAFAMRMRIEGCRTGNIVLPPQKDPDEVPRDWLNEAARECLMQEDV